MMSVRGQCHVIHRHRPWTIISDDQRIIWSRRNDRDEIRRKLAMGADEDYYGGERAFKKPSLQTRLQGGMNLQLCFMNEAPSDQEMADSGDPSLSPLPSPSSVSPSPLLTYTRTHAYNELLQPMQFCFINDIPSEDDDYDEDSKITAHLIDSPVQLGHIMNIDMSTGDCSELAFSNSTTCRPRSEQSLQTDMKSAYLQYINAANIHQGAIQPTQTSPASHIDVTNSGNISYQNEQPTGTPPHNIDIIGALDATGAVASNQPLPDAASHATYGRSGGGGGDGGDIGNGDSGESLSDHDVSVRPRDIMSYFEPPKQIRPPPLRQKAALHRHMTPRPVSEADIDLYQLGGKVHAEGDDFFSKQARLQAEARMALAQVRPMAHMQLEVEKQSRKKSPIAEIVGIPGIGGRRVKKLTHHLMFTMNVAQLQVLVNDLHSQIEALNEDLVNMLIARDDLHMEQDSMLVDIEDFTRRAQECATKMNEQKKTKKPAIKLPRLPCGGRKK